MEMKLTLALLLIHSVHKQVDGMVQGTGQGVFGNVAAAAAVPYAAGGYGAAGAQLGFVNPAYLAMKSYGLNSYGTQFFNPYGTQPLSPYGFFQPEKEKPRMLTCAARIEVDNYHRRSQVFIAATIEEEKQALGYGNMYGSFGSFPQTPAVSYAAGFGQKNFFSGVPTADPYSSSSSLSMDLEIHSYGGEGKAKVVFTRKSQPFVDLYNGCDRDTIGEVLFGFSDPFKGFGAQSFYGMGEYEPGVVATAALWPKSTSTVHTNNLPFKSLEELAGRGLAVVVPLEKGDTIVGGTIQGDIVACCKLAYDDRKRTLLDVGFGSQAPPKQPPFQSPPPPPPGPGY